LIASRIITGRSGAILVIAWLFAFWFAVQRWILAPAASDDMVPTIE